MRQAHVFYSGHVQGVGFRYTTFEIARGFAVTGWVRNLYDGRVELVVEGEEPVVRDFLAAVRGGSLRRYITGVEATWAEGTGQFADFRTVSTAPE